MDEITCESCGKGSGLFGYGNRHRSHTVAGYLALQRLQRDLPFGWVVTARGDVYCMSCWRRMWMQDDP